MKRVVDRGSVVVAVLLLLGGSIEGEAQGRKHQPASHVPRAFGYRLDKPDQTMALSDALQEISDLALAPDQESLWAVHDQKGTLFRIAIKDGSVLQTLEFHKKGDFEGIAFIGGKVIAGRSDGELFLIDPATGQTTHLRAPLGGDCNLEGLAWDQAKNRLLLACKSPIGPTDKQSWAVYSLDWTSREMQKEPALSITRQEIESYLRQHPEQTHLKGWMATRFDPSGIAIHPRSGLIYMVSTRGRLLMVLDPKGKVLRIEPLRRSVHPQPEGIAFLPDGTLFLSSEGRRGRPLLLRFSALAQ